MAMIRFDVIDRRQNPKGKNLPNRERFLRRQRDAVKEAIKDLVREGKVGDVLGGDKKIKVSKKSIREPTFHHDRGGVAERVFTGNRRYVPGDTIPRPPGGMGGDGSEREGSPDGEGTDDFIFAISEEEFLKYFFEDLELPDIVKRTLATNIDYVWKRAGYSPVGPPPKLDIVRTMRQAQARRYTFRKPKEDRLAELHEERDRILECLTICKEADREELNSRLAAIEAEIEELERALHAIPFLDTLDARYRLHDKTPAPMWKAVMFALMDVSGSMGQEEKDLAKRFFMLLYLFLRRHYDRVDIIFIRHHHQAKEVDEEEFFRGRETGGTIISSAYELMLTIIRERYPINDWNLYLSYAGDGETWGGDIERTIALLDQDILPLLQYCAHIEIRSSSKYQSNIWTKLEELKTNHKHFAMAVVEKLADIFPVFYELFKKKAQEGSYGATL